MNVIAQIEAEQIAALGNDIPDFKAGDTIRVGFKVTEGTRTRLFIYFTHRENIRRIMNGEEGVIGS